MAAKKEPQILKFKEGFFAKMEYEDSKQYFDEFEDMAKRHMVEGLSKTQIKKANAKIFNESREMLIKYKVHYYQGAFWKMLEIEKGKIEVSPNDNLIPPENYDQIEKGLKGEL